MSDDCNPRGIPRPTIDELVLHRRLRILRDVLDDPDDPLYEQLTALCDLLVETDAEQLPRTTPGGQLVLGMLPEPKGRK